MPLENIGFYIVLSVALVFGYVLPHHEFVAFVLTCGFILVYSMRLIVYSVCGYAWYKLYRSDIKATVPSSLKQRGFVEWAVNIALYLLFLFTGHPWLAFFGIGSMIFVEIITYYMSVWRKTMLATTVKEV